MKKKNSLWPFWYFLLWFKKWQVFQWRASRSEYWWFYLFSNIVYAIPTIFDEYVISIYWELTIFEEIISTFIWLYFLATIVPTLAITARRLHDTNRSGRRIAILLIPFIWPIWFIILLILPGTKWPNDYGEDPLEEQKNKKIDKAENMIS